MKDKHITIGILGVGLSSWIVLIWLLVWVFWPYKAIDIAPLKVLNDNKTVTNGILLYEVDYHKYTDKSCLVSRIIIQNSENGEKFLIILPSYPSNVMAGKNKVPIKLLLPANMPAGDKYVLVITFMYEMNPFRKIEIVSKSEEFSVM